MWTVSHNDMKQVKEIMGTNTLHPLSASVVCHMVIFNLASGLSEYFETAVYINDCQTVLVLLF